MDSYYSDDAETKTQYEKEADFIKMMDTYHVRDDTVIINLPPDEFVLACTKALIDTARSSEFDSPSFLSYLSSNNGRSKKIMDKYVRGADYDSLTYGQLKEITRSALKDIYKDSLIGDNGYDDTLGDVEMNLLKPTGIGSYGKEQLPGRGPGRGGSKTKNRRRNKNKNRNKNRKTSKRRRRRTRRMRRRNN